MQIRSSWSSSALSSTEKTVYPHLYAFITAVWVISLVWFGPRLLGLMSNSKDAFTALAIGFFIVFTCIAWLYAVYNFSFVIFALLYRRYAKQYTRDAPLPAHAPAIGVLYTTRNDFVEAAALSCIAQDYPDYTVYILDDSSEPEFKARVDAFADEYSGRVQVVRRTDRKGFKAGNINHGLTNVALEPFFALVDADEILPPEFLRKLVPRLLTDEGLGFIQANHRANPTDPNPLPNAMNIGVDIHWRWYQPLRNRFGFVMLLGHGALIRRSCWTAVGGFPELVSEDLAFALRVREHGWRGEFAEDVICFESFPEDLRAFRVRFMKWTRGTCEFLVKELGGLLRARRIPLVEKIDVLLPALGWPLSLFFFVYLLDINLVLMGAYGRSNPVSFSFLGQPLEFSVRTLDQFFNPILGLDFRIMTLFAVLAPVLCFGIEFIKQPGRVVRFVSSSMVVNGALGPLSFVGVLLFAATGKAVFHVTADRSERRGAANNLQANGFQAGAPQSELRRLMVSSHPDHWAIQAFEVFCGLFFAVISIGTAQISFLGLAVGYLLQPLLHHLAWENPLARRIVHLPFALVIGGFAFTMVAWLRG
jgi:cellulose synthase/poly-beta-1,6-N-acetylglucosamine synthase-like glycosyltransferase